MVAFILPANSASSGGYEIDNSCRFDGSSSYMSRASIGAGNRRSWTLSMWVKKSKIITNTEMFTWSSDQNSSDGSTHDGGGFYGIIQTDIVATANHNYFVLSDGDGRIISSANARDPSAWQHMVWQVDTASSTEADRLKLYINGERITSQQKSQEEVAVNKDTNWNRDGSTMYLGNDQPYTRYYFDGYMAEVAFIDGQSYDASQFGETNSNGVWVPKEFKDDVTFGTNGFYMEFKQTGTSQNSSGIGADTSGNDNHFAVSNLAATDVTVDTPTNNFATWNPLAERPGDGFITASEGNVKATGSSKHAFPTIAFPTSGKWYVEVKFTAGSSTAHLGLRDADDYTADGNSNRLYYRNDGDKDDGGTTSSYGASWTNSIISIAVNLDDNEVTFYKDGTAQNSGTALSHDASNQYLSAGTAGSYTVEGNFGNPSFAISSGNADANGYGNFEYAVPSGFYSLCTKNLAEYG